jgi:N-hydroxyarylamine O-acetyltransferase
MKRFQSDREAYLERLDYSGTLRPTAEDLATLHRAQISSIPFENFDICLDRTISLEPAALCDKLIHHPRGGYCFELNGLFLLALGWFGFDARPLLARVHVSGTPGGRGHQITLVNLKGRQWIADVGFGHRGLRYPIPLELDRPSTQCGWQYRLTNAGPFGTMLQTRSQERWQDLYSFDLGYVFPQDIALGHHFTATHPSSIFTSTRVAVLPVKGGVKTLNNLTLKQVTAKAETVQELAEGRAYLEALKRHFGIELDVPYEALHPWMDKKQDPTKC